MKLLKDALVMLSLPSSEQRRLNGPGCLTCDMIEDFHLACRVVREDPSLALSPEQSRVLQEIADALHAAPEEDCECFSSEAVDRPAWQAIRKRASSALSVFAWQNATVEPFKEIAPGQWKRP